MRTVRIEGDLTVEHDTVRITWLSALGSTRVWVEPLKESGVDRRELTFIAPLVRATANSDPLCWRGPGEAPHDPRHGRLETPLQDRWLGWSFGWS